LPGGASNLAIMGMKNPNTIVVMDTIAKTVVLMMLYASVDRKSVSNSYNNPNATDPLINPVYDTKLSSLKLIVDLLQILDN
jgi:hypothetical protein